MQLNSLKKISVPKVTVLATGLAAALMVITISPTPAQALPNEQKDCTGCHSVGNAPGFMQVALLGAATMAPSTDYAIKIDMATTANNGNSGWWIAESDAAGVTGTTANVCRQVSETPACFGGPAGSTTFFPRMTAPETPGTYYYKVWMSQGTPAASEAYSATFSITVTVPAISGLSPTHGTIGDSVTIQGSGFGAAAGSVAFATASASVSSWTDTTITVLVPDGTHRVPVTVTRSDGAVSNGVMFRFDHVRVPHVK